MIDLSPLRTALAELGFPPRQREALIRGAFARLGVPLRRATEDDLALALRGPLAQEIQKQIPGFFPAGSYRELMDTLAGPPLAEEEGPLPVEIQTPEGREALMHQLENLRGLAGVYFLPKGQSPELYGTPPSEAILNLLRHAAEETAAAGAGGTVLVLEDRTYGLKVLRGGVVIISLHPWAGHGVLLDLIGRMSDANG